jgi:hypothetical protein
MICADCVWGAHTLCHGGTWCDCQHHQRTRGERELTAGEHPTGIIEDLPAGCPQTGDHAIPPSPEGGLTPTTVPSRQRRVNDHKR